MLIKAFKEKSWVWWFTFPFADNNFTTLWETLYYPKGSPPDLEILSHEEVHAEQQHLHPKWFLPLWIYLYLVAFPLGLPLFWNFWRFKWEYEAYVLGSQISTGETLRILRSYRYGWLIFHKSFQVSLKERENGSPL